MLLSPAGGPSVRSEGNAELVRERAEDDVVEGLTGRGGLGLNRVPDLVGHPEKEDGTGAGKRALAPGRPIGNAERVC